MTTKTIDFDQLLWPETRHDFVRDYFQKRPYVLHRDDPHFYDGLISLADVESLAFSIDTPESYHQRWLDISTSKGNKPHPLANELFDEHGIIPARVITYYQQGHTLVLNHLQQYWPSINLLCKHLEESLSTYTHPLPFGKVYAGVFLTPPNAQALFPHYDDVDVFILQLEGSKQWSIYNQLARFPSQAGPKLPKAIIGDPIQTRCLNTGDMIYIPSGYPHEAFTDKGHSLHLTIGLSPYSWKQTINNLVAIDDEQTNHPLPLTLPDTPSAPPLLEQFDAALHHMSSEQALTAALKQIQSSHLAKQIPLADDYLHQINLLQEITLATRLYKRHGQAYQMVETTTHLSLQFPGNRLLLPRECKDALYFILATDVFAVGSLPAMKQNDALFSLLHRLIGSGFLKTCEEIE